MRAWKLTMDTSSIGELFILLFKSRRNFCVTLQHTMRVWARHSGGPQFRMVRHSESRNSWSLQGIVLDIATTRRLTLTVTLTLTVSLTVSCHCWKEMAENDGPSEWRADTYDASFVLQTFSEREQWTWSPKKFKFNNFAIIKNNTMLLSNFTWLWMSNQCVKFRVKIPNGC